MMKAGFIVDDVRLVPRPTILPAGTGMRGWLSTFTQAFLNAIPEDSSSARENTDDSPRQVLAYVFIFVVYTSSIRERGILLYVNCVHQYQVVVSNPALHNVWVVVLWAVSGHI